MIFITIAHGVYKPTNITGGPQTLCASGFLHHGNDGFLLERSGMDQPFSAVVHSLFDMCSCVCAVCFVCVSILYLHILANIWKQLKTDQNLQDHMLKGFGIGITSIHNQRLLCVHRGIWMFYVVDLPEMNRNKKIEFQLWGSTWTKISCAGFVAYWSCCARPPHSIFHGRFLWAHLFPNVHCKVLKTGLINSRITTKKLCVCMYSCLYMHDSVCNCAYLFSKYMYINHCTILYNYLYVYVCVYINIYTFISYT